jgi:ADP-ribose pyrophosphatase YjhB (NUDIX family)
VKEESSLNVEPLEILGVYSEPTRDPRGHIMSVVFICLTVDDLSGKAGDDAKEMHWINLSEIEKLDLAFDHKKILQDYIKWRRHNSTYWSSKK